MNKIISPEEAMGFFENNQTLMIGGFIKSGTPEKLIKLVIEKGVNNITLISNTTGFESEVLGQLIVKKRVSKVVGSYIGANQESIKQMNEGKLEVELVPQGNLIEKIRSGGVGLGGVLTPTGLGTIVEKEKRKINIDGREYLLELPLTADIALIKAWKADTIGNLIYRYTARNFNPVMAMAADIVIVEAEEIVPIGELDPNLVMTPSIFVDYIVENMNQEV